MSAREVPGRRRRLPRPSVPQQHRLGYNSVRGQLIASTDRTTWQTRSTIGLRDFDVSPVNQQTLLATTDTGLQRSSDGGTAWTKLHS